MREKREDWYIRAECRQRLGESGSLRDRRATDARRSHHPECSETFGRTAPHTMAHWEVHKCELRTACKAYSGLYRLRTWDRCARSHPLPQYQLLEEE